MLHYVNQKLKMKDTHNIYRVLSVYVDGTIDMVCENNGNTHKRIHQQMLDICDVVPYGINFK